MIELREQIFRDDKMPVFGARMVCEAGHYNLAQERSKAEQERETNLG